MGPGGGKQATFLVCFEDFGQPWLSFTKPFFFRFVLNKSPKVGEPNLLTSKCHIVTYQVRTQEIHSWATRRKSLKKKSHNILSNLIIFCWTAFIGIHMWPTGLAYLDHGALGIRTTSRSQEAFKPCISSIYTWRLYSQVRQQIWMDIANSPWSHKGMNMVKMSWILSLYGYMRDQDQGSSPWWKWLVCRHRMLCAPLRHCRLSRWTRQWCWAWCWTDLGVLLLLVLLMTDCQKFWCWKTFLKCEQNNLQGS